MPTWVIIFTGCANVVTYVPIFITGFITLGRKGAVGQADKLRTWGVYKYLRNPMYAGASFTLFGLGLIIGNTGVAAAGLVWLVICTIQTKMEEKSLADKFGNEYLEYRNNTPLFVPEFEKLIKDLLIAVKNI